MFTWNQLYMVCFMNDVSGKEVCCRCQDVLTVVWTDLVNVVDASWRPNVGSMSPAELKAYITKRDHCSSLVKVTSDLSSLYACKSIHCTCNVKGLIVNTH